MATGRRRNPVSVAEVWEKLSFPVLEPPGRERPSPTASLDLGTAIREQTATRGYCLHTCQLSPAQRLCFQCHRDFPAPWPRWPQPHLPRMECSAGCKHNKSCSIIQPPPTLIILLTFASASYAVSINGDLIRGLIHKLAQ